MLTIARITLAVALGTAASGTSLLAQASAPMMLASATAVGTSATSYDPAMVQVRLARADEWALKGRSSAARREYSAIAAMQRASHVLPEEAMWKLASEYHADRSWDQAASVLKELADDAERFGNPQVQAKALLEATILYSYARMPQDARACATRLDLLLASPHVSDEFRQAVQRRITQK